MLPVVSSFTWIWGDDPNTKTVVSGGLKNTASPDPGKVFPEMLSTFSARIADNSLGKLFDALEKSPEFRILLGMPIGYHRIHVMIYLPTNHKDYPNVYIYIFIYIPYMNPMR